MLHVKTPEEVLALIENEFDAVAETELVSLSAAMGRVLARDIAATEYVPDFDRSTVDGYAVRARVRSNVIPVLSTREKFLGSKGLYSILIFISGA